MRRELFGSLLCSDKKTLKKLFFPVSTAALPPFGPIEGYKWFDQVPANETEEPVCIDIFR
jgi:hypothetical protein